MSLSVHRRSADFSLIIKMVRKIKAGIKGEASQYKTRSNAIRDL
jgi:hypothetical protein